MGDALLRKLADVDQALEALGPDEGTEVDDLGDRALDDVADLEIGHRRVPRIRLQPADREADPAALVIDVDDFGLDLFADAIAGLGLLTLFQLSSDLCTSPSMPPRSTNTPNGAIERTVPLTCWPTLRLLKGALVALLRSS